MATSKSPFYIIPDFLSPKQCEQIIASLEIYSPDVDQEGNPVKMYRYKEEAELTVFERLEPLIPNIIQYYDAEYMGTEMIQFEYFAPGIKPEPHCENSNYLKKKWVRTKGRDLSGVLFLTTYNETPDFDDDYEVYGGKLEFPQHNFSFNPTRGTLVIYPSGPHFINATSMVEVGEAYQARIHMATQLPYLYQPVDFPGDYRTWFKGL